MNSINFFYYFLIVIFSLLIVAGFLKAKSSKGNQITIMLCMIAVIVGSYNLFDKLYNGPSLSSLLEYYSEFQSINIDSIGEIILYVDIVERKTIKETIIIKEKNKINSIISNLNDIKPIYGISSGRRSIISSCDIEIISDSMKYYFTIDEYTDGNFHIDLNYIDSRGGKHTAGLYKKKVYTNSILRIKNLADIDVKPDD